MPKKSAKASKEKKEEGEGRPPDLTLALFIKDAKPRGPKKSAVCLNEDEATPSPLWAAQPRQAGARAQDGSDPLEVENSGLPEEVHSRIGAKEDSEKRSGKLQGLAMADEPANETSSSGDKPSSSTATQKGGASAASTDDFKIMRTKKGGYPIYLEKRAKGKKVTVIRQVKGNSKHLLQILKTKFGTGGLTKPGEVEIQGDFESKLLKFLKENNQYMVQYKPG